MNYNELTFHKANPFYKQDFIPDRAWFNRKAKEYPSQMPSGKDYFVQSGRKHFTNRFNHSEIQQTNILKSPQRYPFQNRIAFDKTYMRSLHTIDIQGASSNTRVNQSIKNKYKAQDQLARRYNQSIDLSRLKQKTEQQKRRDVALRQFEEYQDRKTRKENSKTIDLELSKSTVKKNNPEKQQPSSIQRELSDQYKRFVIQNSSNKFSKDIQVPQTDSQSSFTIVKNNQQKYKPSDESNKRFDNLSESGQKSNFSSVEPERHIQTYVSQKQPPTPQSHYQNQYSGQQWKNNQEYQRILKYEQMSRKILQNPRDFRKNSPTNLSLSFNLAGQSIVSN